MGTPGSPDTSRYQADETGEIVTSWALHTRLAHSYWGVDRDRMDAASGETPDVWAIVNEDGEERTLRRIDDEPTLAEVEPDIYVDVGVPMGSDVISVTLTAKEKAGRYYAESTIRHLVAECDGTLFWDDRQHLHILRTRRENAGYDYVCLLLAIEEEGVTSSIRRRTTTTGRRWTLSRRRSDLLGAET